jgi:GNAT superfamily N-acetyltransferase
VYLGVAVAADGTILGFVTRLPLGAGVLEVEDLFVDPDRTRERVARRLIENLTAAAKRDGAELNRARDSSRHAGLCP